MSLQNNIELNPVQLRAGLQYSGANPANTRSMFFVTSKTDGVSGLPGKFVSRTSATNQVSEIASGTDPLNSIVGAVVDSKLYQNAPANYGTGYKNFQGDNLMIMTSGAICVQTTETLDIDAVDIFCISDDNGGTGEDIGKLCNTLPAGYTGILVGGLNYNSGNSVAAVHIIKAIGELAVVQISFS